MTKILIGRKEQKNGYFELGYTFTLELPSDQVSALSKVDGQVSTTSEVTGTATFADGTDIATIKADLQAKYAIEQQKVNDDQRLTHYGIAWDGEKWS